MPVTVGVAVGAAIEDDERLAPSQLNTVVFGPAPALRFTVPPLHIGPLLVGDADGTALIVTVTLPSGPQQPPGP